MSRHAFLSDVVVAWEGHGALLDVANVETSVRVDEESATLAVEVKGAAILGLVQAWQNASCLDFTYTITATRASTLLFSGPCQDRPEMERRLRLAVNAIIEASQAQPKVGSRQ